MALSGMTGFARREGAQGLWTWAVEARSVNGRNLETRFRGPPGFEGLDRTAREGAQARFQRGQINVNLSARKAEGAAAVRINTEQLDRLIAASRAYVATGEVERPSFDGLLSLRGVLEQAEDGEDAEGRAALELAMAATILETMDELKRARGEEGAALAPVLTGQVDRIQVLVAMGEVQAAAQGPALKERFARRMAELTADMTGLEERVVQEAAMLAGKADVREELDRLVAHVAAARTLLTGDGAAGRRLDFLAQEFMREANTLCSKSAASDLTATGLELKVVIEQFREQVQNVE